MVDASKGFRKDGPKNRLREQDIHRIVDTFNRQQEVPGYARIVPVSEIADPKNDYNLNLPRYIDSTEAEDIQDLTAHLRGGIPERDLDALHAYWDVIPGVRAALFKKTAHRGYSQLRIPAADIKTTIFSHSEFTAFNESATKLFGKWSGNAKPQLGAKKKAAELGLSAPSEDAEEIAALQAYVKLAERYASPLPQLTDEVEQLAAKVAQHLKKMGVEA